MFSSFYFFNIIYTQSFSHVDYYSKVCENDSYIRSRKIPEGREELINNTDLVETAEIINIIGNIQGHVYIGGKMKQLH